MAGLFDNLPFIFKPLEDLKYTKDYADFRLFAIKKHGMQMYEPNLPYSYHLAMVESYIEEYDYTEYEYKAAAWLHDVVEDTKVTIKTVDETFGTRVAALVWACTGVGNNRTERAASIYDKLKKYPDAAPVKVCDRLANMSHGIATNNKTKLDMYKSEWLGFKENVEPLMVTRRDRILWNCLSNIIEGLN